MASKKKEYFTIDEFEFIGIERSVKGSSNKGFHKRFIKSLGLEFVSYIIVNNSFHYKFKIIDEQKFFLSRIKYGL